MLVPLVFFFKHKTVSRAGAVRHPLDLPADSASCARALCVGDARASLLAHRRLFPAALCQSRGGDAAGVSACRAEALAEHAAQPHAARQSAAESRQQRPLRRHEGGVYAAAQRLSRSLGGAHEHVSRGAGEWHLMLLL